MTNTGVFGLSGYNDKNLEGLIPDKTREALREYGYFGGEVIPLDRVDFSNDTATATVRNTGMFVHRSGTVGNKNYGYFSSGYVDYSGIQRLDYSNDTTHSRRANLPFGRQRNSGVGNNNFGYWVGGLQYYQLVPNVTDLSSVDRMDYSNDLVPLLTRASLNIIRYKPAVSSNSNFGYISSGGANLTSVERINFSNDNTTPSFRGFITISSFNGGVEATGNNNFGYYGGGADLPGGTTICRIDYANDTANASVRGPLNGGRWSGSACGNSNFGYFGAGTNFQPSGYYGRSDVERIDYSNDTVNASFRGPLNYGTSYGCSVSSGSFGGSPISQYGVFAKPFGYFGGGSLSTVDRIDYSSDTSAARTRGPLSSSRYALAATGNSNFGYFGGGESFGSTLVDRIDYLNDTSTALVRGPLSVRKGGPAATGNGNFGWFGGGYDFPNYKSGVDRINYANDLQIALQRGPLTANTYRLAATGTLNFGYFGGGFPGPRSTVDRINYSNDTATASVRGPLSGSIYRLSATGNQNFGYFGGGGSSPSPVSIVNRIDYSNDTTTASVRGPLSLAKTTLAATGNQNFGYFGGGSNASIPASYSTTDRIDYANDTATASIRGVLSSAKSNLVGASPTAFGGATDFTPTQQFFDIQSMRRIEDTTNASVKKRALGSYGYFGGGYRGGPTLQSSVERIDYSSDSTNLSFRGFVPGYLSIGTGNNNYGYIKTGYGEVTLYRTDYSNDLSNNVIRGSLARTRVKPGASTNQNYSWWSGGFSLYTAVDRVDYSNDNVTASIRGSLVSSVGSYGSAVGNNDYGYVNTGGSIIHRINYSNDLPLTSFRTPLPIPTVYSGTAIGNLNFGYFSGNLGSTSFNRIDYSNDNATASLRGLTGSETGINGYTGNSNFGYYAGGSSNQSQVTRFNYSNDLSSGVRVNSLNIGRTTCAGLTNARSS